jgi:hypothetical protein
MKDTRLIALIEAGQMRALKAAAKREKVSLAEIVRRALTNYLRRWNDGKENHPIGPSQASGWIDSIWQNAVSWCSAPGGCSDPREICSEDFESQGGSKEVKSKAPRAIAT